MKLYQLLLWFYGHLLMTKEIVSEVDEKLPSKCRLIVCKWALLELFIILSWKTTDNTNCERCTVKRKNSVRSSIFGTLPTKWMFPHYYRGWNGNILHLLKYKSTLMLVATVKITVNRKSKTISVHKLKNDGYRCLGWKRNYS